MKGRDENRGAEVKGVQYLHQPRLNPSGKERRGLDLQIEQELISDKIEELLEGGDSMVAAEPDFPNLGEGALLYRPLSVGESFEVSIMKEDQLPVGCHLQIDLQAMDAESHRRLNRLKRIFRVVFCKAPVGED